MESRSTFTSTHILMGGLVLVATGMLLAIFNAPGLALSSTPPMPRIRMSGGGLGDDAGAPPVEYTAEPMRDPMASLLPQAPAAAASAPGAPGTAASVAPAALTEPPAVQGMVWGSGRPQALIDGELYEVGEMIGNAKILAITRDGVTVSVGGAYELWHPLRPLYVPMTPQGGQR